MLFNAMRQALSQITAKLFSAISIMEGDRHV